MDFFLGNLKADGSIAKCFACTGYTVLAIRGNPKETNITERHSMLLSQRIQFEREAYLTLQLDGIFYTRKMLSLKEIGMQFL